MAWLQPAKTADHVYLYPMLLLVQIAPTDNMWPKLNDELSHHQWLKTYARTWRFKEVEYCEGGIPSECEPLFPNRMCSACNLSLQDSVDPNPREVCAGPSVNINQYKITFQSGSTVSTESVDIARCTGGRCSYTFVPPSNPPSSYDSVSVAAENVVGVGAARTCTTQTISELPEVTMQTHSLVL